MKQNKIFKVFGLASMTMVLGTLPLVVVATSCSNNDESFIKQFSFDQASAKENFGVSPLTTASLTKEVAIQTYNIDVKANLAILAADLLNYCLSLVTFKPETTPVYEGTIDVEYHGQTAATETTPACNILSGGICIKFPEPENVTAMIDGTLVYVRKLEYKFDKAIFTKITNSTDKIVYANNSGLNEKITYTINTVPTPPYDKEYQKVSEIDVSLPSWYLKNITFSN